MIFLFYFIYIYIIYKMSFSSGCSQRVLNNTFSNNTTVEVDINVLNSLSSINYVNSQTTTINNEITTINNEIATINSTLTTLQNEINNLQTEINTLTNSIVRITGSFIMSLSSTPPNNSLYCDGSSYLVSSYQNLFNVIGYAYGGSGTNFNVPDLRSKFLLGANGSLNNVPASNLISGNGTVGALNNYYISGNSWTYSGSVLPNFCIQQYVPQHYHNINDPGHSHSIGDTAYGAYAPSTTTFINDQFTAGQLTNSGSADANVSINNVGTNIQQIDPISGISGVNYTPPFFSVFVYINT